MRGAPPPPPHPPTPRPPLSVHDAPLATAAVVLSIADGDQGELFFYIADFDSGASGVSEWNASLTLSQAGLNATTGCEALSLDPEDPRCAKATYSGVMRKACCGAQTKGKAALFRRHPAMASWPEGHNFQVYELAVSDVWIIDGYGGAATFTGKEYYAAKPRHNVPSFPPAEGGAAAERAAAAAPPPAPPPHGDVAARARRVAASSLWCSIATTSVWLEGRAWGNVRSVADGATHSEATGLPVLYLPTPDLTAVDVRADPRVTISLSEAALPERVAGGQVCGGADPEDPTCARLHLRGSLRALDGDEKADAERALGARHPHAPWLGKGGAHTGGKYYTIELSSIEFLDFYGGFADLSVDEYLKWTPPAAGAAAAAAVAAA